MKRTYEVPTIEAKEYAQLENVFTYCDKLPSSTPVCYSEDADSGDISDVKTNRNDLGDTGKGVDTCVTYFDDNSMGDL